MSYKEAMEAAGATVKAFEEFGSYQGDWWALVEYQGRRGWVGGSYGSCSGCDAFESEFMMCDRENYNAETGLCEPNPNYTVKLAEFGRTYLDEIKSDQAALNEAARNLDWDCDAELMVKFIADHAKADGVLVIVPKASSQ